MSSLVPFVTNNKTESTTETFSLSETYLFRQVILKTGHSGSFFSRDLSAALSSSSDPTYLLPYSKTTRAKA